MLDNETSENLDLENSELTSEEDLSEETSEELSEESSEETSETIDYTEQLTLINDNLDLISSRLDYLSASVWIFLSIAIAVIFYRIFAWFWKDL